MPRYKGRKGPPRWEEKNVGRFRGERDQVPEINNCVLGMVAAGLPGGKTLRIKNSLLAFAWIGASQDEPGYLEISDRPAA